MKIKSIKFFLTDNKFFSEQQIIEFKTGDSLPISINQANPVLLLVSKIDATTLIQREVVHHIGEKSESKGLAHHFSRKETDKIPLLECYKYVFPGKLIAGIKAFLSTIKGSSRPVMIASSARLFDLLWEIAEKKEEKLKQEISPEHFHNKETRARNQSMLKRLNEHVKEPSELQEKYIGNAESVQLVRKQMTVAARSDIPVLVMGDSGTGKEIVAREIHNISLRNKHPFKAINCGAISLELLELELFGCEKDVVGHGYPARTGVWEAAEHGTLFLDEIGDLSLYHQVKILRTAQENTIRRVGSNKEIPVHARIIAASNKNLFAMANSGLFRFDLFYRLNGIPIRTPRLRDHIEDIEPISQALWKGITQDNQATLFQDVLDFLKRFSWPGNVRELKMALSGLFALYHKTNPTVSDMQDTFVLQGHCLHNHDERAITGDPIRDHRVKCLQHLKTTHEVLHGLIFELEAVKRAGGKRTKTTDHSNSTDFFGYELQELCGKASYYLYKSSLIRSLKKICEQLTDYKRPLQQESLRKNIVEELKNIMTQVTDTISDVLHEASA
jgi:DNA-binding NtrC family response regulator